LKAALYSFPDPWSITNSFSFISHPYRATCAKPLPDIRSLASIRFL
ncbi:599_t:CDS:2, partial [Gigaspora rosea]